MGSSSTTRTVAMEDIVIEHSLRAAEFANAESHAGQANEVASDFDETISLEGADGRCVELVQ